MSPAQMPVAPTATSVSSGPGRGISHVPTCISCGASIMAARMNRLLSSCLCHAEEWLLAAQDAQNVLAGDLAHPTQPLWRLRRAVGHRDEVFEGQQRAA